MRTQFEKHETTTTARRITPDPLSPDVQPSRMQIVFLYPHCTR